MIGAGVPHAADYINDWMQKRRCRVLVDTAEAVGGDEHLANVLRDQPDLVPLVLRAADASAKSTWDAHVAALAAALRAGVVGETSVSGAERLLAAIVSMTPEAVAALVYMLSHEPHSDEGHFVDTTVADDLGISRSRVRVAFRRLEEGGAAEMVGALFDGGEGWVPTEVSQAVLDHLSNAGAT